MIAFDLGGIGRGTDGWQTVNLLNEVDIRADILDLDGLCGDETVDKFRMSHTLDLVPIVLYPDFVRGLRRKLKPGGELEVVQTNIKGAVKLFSQEKLDFYCLRDILFAPIDRSIQSYQYTGRNLQQHQFAWGPEELRDELLHFGFSKVEIFDAGTWSFDYASHYPFQKNEKFFGVNIPNLGVKAWK